MYAQLGPGPQKKQHRAGVNAQQHHTRNPVTEHRHRRMPSTQSVRLDKDILHSCDTPFESSTFLHVRERECETDDSSRSNGEHHDAQCTPQAVSSMGKLPLWTPAAAPHCLSSFSAYIRRPRMIYMMNVLLDFFVEAADYFSIPLDKSHS